MNDDELNRVLRHAASATATGGPSLLHDAIMARVRVDDGRARRWRAFVRWLLLSAALSGLAAAVGIGWSLAVRDTTHSKPPAMRLFQEGTP